MTRDFASRFTAVTFFAAAAMLWLGWMVMPVHLGTFFQPEDFAKVNAHLHLWIWTYRVHLFGMIVAVIALVALGSQLVGSPARVVAWPGIAVAAGGLFVGAVGAAFYYHHGAWGAQQMEGKSPDEIQRFVEALRIDTEYITCLVRFSRVFSGLGLVLLGWALAGWRILPRWIGVLAALIGLAAIAVTMGLPDDLSLYMPIFHVLAFWLAAMGAVIFRHGLRLGD